MKIKGMWVVMSAWVVISICLLIIPVLGVMICIMPVKAMVNLSLDPVRVTEETLSSVSISNLTKTHYGNPSRSDHIAWTAHVVNACNQHTMYWTLYLEITNAGITETRTICDHIPVGPGADQLHYQFSEPDPQHPGGAVMQYEVSSSINYKESCEFYNPQNGFDQKTTSCTQ
jgi:hypothetical protein